MDDAPLGRQSCIYVDVDDTLLRSVGSKRIPATNVIAKVRSLAEQGAVLYCWSSAGADYAERSARECGVERCIAGFLPKPTMIIDDQPVNEWRYCRTMHPRNC